MSHELFFQGMFYIIRCLDKFETFLFKLFVFA
jgi:hypothetical protein